MPEFRRCCWTLLFPVEAQPERGGGEGHRDGDQAEARRVLHSGSRELITPGNFEDNLEGHSAIATGSSRPSPRIWRSSARCWRRWPPLRTPGTIVSTNTSGIPLAAISEGFDSEFRQHFLGTHFFNPPRYLHLVEVIPGRRDPARSALDSCVDFCDRRLGKGVVPCKDTPNFIANRIGSFFGATIQKITVEDGYTIEEVDALTGPLIGLPEERQLPAAGYRRPRRLGACRAQSLRIGSQ